MPAAFRKRRTGFAVQSPSGEARPSKTQVISDRKRAQMARELQSRTNAEVRFGAGDRALYATDGSNYRFVPVGVVVPRSIEDVVGTVAVCREHGAAVLPRGGGTDLSGSSTNTAVIIDMSKYLRDVLSIDPERREARVLPGTVLDQLRKKSEAQYGLTFGPDPATHNHNTFGGMLGNNSCGVHSILAAKVGPGARTSDNTKELEVLTYDGLRLCVGPTDDLELARIIRQGGRRGEIYRAMKELRDRYAPMIRTRFPKIPRRVSGYNLDDLLPEKGFNVARALVGSEGTLVTILEATLELIPVPKHCSLVVLGYSSAFEAADHVPEILKFGPIALEGIDQKLVRNIQKKGEEAENLKFLPEGEGFLLVELPGDTQAEADARGEALITALKVLPGHAKARMYLEQEQETKLWEIRESGLGATARVPGEKDTWPGWEDSAVPPEKAGDYLRELQKLYDKYGYSAALYGHFGQGCIHTRIPFDLKSHGGIEKYRDFMEEAADLCVRMGGSLSGEHGDGQSRGELLEKMYGPELMQAFREFKTIWDPEWKMNPGKVIDARPFTSDLRLGTDYNPLPVRTYFKYPEDEGSFARATSRCVGVGKCRRTESGTMCPSYMVTREEKHSTRGRARLLFEMLQGNPVRDEWASEAVKDALNLCLACKGCKGDCPVNVDMATYKAEFLAHYYKKKRRPIAAYSMGLIQTWARIASRMPGLANLATQTPGIRELVKEIGGIHPRRDLPPFAEETFQSWFKKRAPHAQTGNRVLLWPDTFNNHFHPETAKSATRVLEAAGFDVEVPQRFVCCGRPLYDYGMLEQAQRYLVRILELVQPAIRDGVPIVVLEPSCASTFKDELVAMFPHDLEAQRMKQLVFTLDEFLTKRAKDFEPPKLRRKALVHGHCHHKSVLSFECEQEFLSKKMGIEVEVPDSGCCGMAGSFGFENDQEKYDVSLACGERVLLPEVRDASDETLIIADGFSCRTQIEQGSPRKALHVAQVIDLALREQARGAEGEPTTGGARPEHQFEEKIAKPSPRELILGPGLGAITAGLVSRLRRRAESIERENRQK